eukprot:364938-Chlamydomonas_euryale.AAC.32
MTPPHHYCPSRVGVTSVASLVAHIAFNGLRPSHARAFQNPSAYWPTKILCVARWVQQRWAQPSVWLPKRRQVSYKRMHAWWRGHMSTLMQASLPHNIGTPMQGSFPGHISAPFHASRPDNGTLMQASLPHNIGTPMQGPFPGHISAPIHAFRPDNSTLMQTSHPFQLSSATALTRCSCLLPCVRSASS